MNILTRVECVASHYIEDVNNKIEEMRKDGWYLRGTPQFITHENDITTFMTFEKKELGVPAPKFE